MKTPLLFFLFLPFALLNAQQTSPRNHFLQPDFYTTVYSGAVMADGNVVLACSAGDRWFFGSDRVWVACMNPLGELLWEKDVPFGAERIEGILAQAFPDTSVVLNIQPSGCDYGLSPVWARLNAQGDLSWVKGDGYTTQEWWPPALPYDDHSFLVTNALGQALRVGFNGQEMGTVAPIPAYDPGYLQLPSGDFLLKSGSVLRQCESELVVKREKNAGGTLLGFDTLSDGRLALLFKDSLVVWDSSWNLLHQTNLVYDAYEMDAAGGRIFVLTYQNNVARFFAFESDLTLTSALSVPKEIAIPRISGPKDHLLFWGTSSAANQNKALFCKTLSADQPVFDEGPDLSIVDIDLADTIWYKSTPWGGPFGGFFSTAFGRVAVTVQNTGTLPVSSYRFHTKETFCPSVCIGEINLTRTIPHQPLMPGESETVVFEDSLFFSCTAGVPGSLCIWVNGPDDVPDVNPDNNRFCKSFSPIIGADAPAPVVPLAVRPNPTSDAVYVHLPLFPCPYRLMSSQGVPAKSGVLHSEMLDLSGLPEGLYQLLLELPEGKTGQARILVVR